MTIVIPVNFGLMVQVDYTLLTVICPPNLSDLLIAQLGELGFDSFLESDTGFSASVRSYDLQEETVISLMNSYPVTYTLGQVEKKNWNEEWEKNVEPTWIDARCLVRASFHSAHPEIPYDIVITPKMSFGTGHHPTTQLMLRTLLDTVVTDSRVVDAGCGTGVLSILASKMGAREIEAFDIDDWSVENAAENAEVNGCTGVRVRKGKISELDLSGSFRTVMANINKNVLMEELPTYAALLETGGILLLSGFYEGDAPDLLGLAASLGFAETNRNVKEAWCCLLLKKM